MKSILRAAARLYPRAWRDRYGDEFDALIDDLHPRWRDVANVLVGAFFMYISTPSLLTLAPSLVVVGIIAGAAVSLTYPAVYASASQVHVTVPDAAVGGVMRADRIRQVVQAAVGLASLDKQHITVTVRGNPDGNPMLLDVVASGDTPQAARGAAQRALNAVVTANLQAQERLKQPPGVQFKLLAAPSLPTTAERPIMRLSLIGAAAGLIAAAAFLIVDRVRWRATAP
jgi:hypothetical protein